MMFNRYRKRICHLFKIHYIIKIVSIEHWYESTCPVQSLCVDYIF